MDKKCFLLGFTLVLGFQTGYFISNYAIGEASVYKEPFHVVYRTKRLKGKPEKK